MKQNILHNHKHHRSCDIHLKKVMLDKYQQLFGLVLVSTVTISRNHIRWDRGFHRSGWDCGQWWRDGKCVGTCESCWVVRMVGTWVQQPACEGWRLMCWMSAPGVLGALGAGRANSRPSGVFSTVYKNSGGWKKFRCLNVLCNCVMVGSFWCRFAGVEGISWGFELLVNTNDWVLGAGG